MEYILDLLKKLKKNKRLSKEIHNEIDFVINDLEKDLGEDDRFQCRSFWQSYSL